MNEKVFKEVRAIKKLDSADEKKYSLFVKFEDDFVTNIKLLDDKNNEMSKENKLDLKTFKKMIDQISLPDSEHYE